jgi:3-dehydroquinate dehydratase/shikimate dehydrogenase
LRNHFHGRLLYSLRSQSGSDNSLDNTEQRHHRLAAAAQDYDLVELESSTDLSESLLALIPVEKRLVSWHGAAVDLSRLQAIFARLSSVPARWYKLVSKASRMSDELSSLSLLKSLGRSDTIAYADGPLGFWSRLAALQLGSPGIFGLVPNGAPIPSEPSITKLIQDYGLPEITSIDELFAIIGNPVFHSLSPRLHNAAYRALGYKALFVPLQVESFAEFWHEVVQTNVLDRLGFPLKGMTVASPHKESARLTAKQVSPMANQGESANLIIRSNGHWEADTTDPEVIYQATRERSIQLMHRRAAVIGCGGAGRAIAAALAQSGARVTLVNRGAERGRHAAKLLQLPFVALSDFDADGYDLVVNATPVGRDSIEAPCKLDQLNTETAVIDLVYGSNPTPLVSNSLAHGRTVIDGRDVLLTQVLRQFRLMTGREMPDSVATDVLDRRPLTTTAISTVPSLIQQGAPLLGTDAN